MSLPFFTFGCDDETHTARFENAQSIFGGRRYTCVIENQIIFMIQALKGEHLKGFTNKDVDVVSIVDCTIYRVPPNLQEYFPNMKSLKITNSDLREVRRHDLISYTNLKSFTSNDNPIVYLPGDLFNGLQNLECVQFWRNNLQLIEPNLLDGLTNLKHVNFKGNTNYNTFFSLYPGKKSEATIEEIKSDFTKKFYARFECVKQLKMSNDQLSHDKQELKKELDKFKSMDTRKGVLRDFQSYLLNDDKKDLTVKIENREIRVHKFVLSIRSPFFARMFHDTPDADNLNLSDVSFEVFDHIIKFIYNNELPKKTNLLHLFSTAGKLEIKELRTFAASKIINQINGDNALTIFQLSCKYGHEDLKKKAYGVIKKKYNVFNFKDEWLTQSDKLANILEGLKRQEDEMKNFEKEFKNLSVKK